MPPNAEGEKVLRRRAHLYIVPTAMTDIAAAPVTAVSAVENIKPVGLHCAQGRLSWPFHFFRWNFMLRWHRWHI